jgi:hypothetical protein
MFDLQDEWFGIFMGLLLSKKYMREFPRANINSLAEKYAVPLPETIKNKTQVVVLIIHAWYNHFQAHPDFFEEYKKFHEIDITLQQMKDFLHEV